MAAGRGASLPPAARAVAGVAPRADETIAPPAPRAGPRRPWFGAARSTRARILATFIILLAVSAILSVLSIRTVLVIRLDDRMQDAGQQEVQELDRLLAVGRDPQTGEPFTEPEALFDAYLARNVPSSEEALVTFVDGRYYRAQMARFPLDQLPDAMIADWAELSSRSPGTGERVNGTFETELGHAYFRVRRVQLGEHTGAFVVAILPAAEMQELNELLTYGVLATLGVLIVASGVAWLIAGRVLAPVRLLTETAQNISQSELAHRIPVRGGSDEAAVMARSFNSMLDRLEAVFRSQRQFVQDASHELRDPLTICSGHLELLPDDPEERQKTVALVMDELDRMGRIVDDLQILADTEQPDFLHPEAMDLGTFTHELLGKVSALAPRKWVLDASAEGTFVADRHRLTEAVLNLAHNAVNHTDADGTIALGTELTASELRVWVRDTGTGVSVFDQPRIFDRFTRGRTARRRYRGSGLGLAIVKAIAEAHGGRVELDSLPGQGSTFTIVIPSPGGEQAADDAHPDR